MLDALPRLAFVRSPIRFTSAIGFLTFTSFDWLQYTPFITLQITLGLEKGDIATTLNNKTSTTILPTLKASKQSRAVRFYRLTPLTSLSSRTLTPLFFTDRIRTYHRTAHRDTMKFLSLPTFDVVTSALNFDTPDCHVTGSCDLYTTKAAGSDKKLYKNIQQSLESQHAALLKFGASLSPPQRDSMAASLNLSRSSPFGSLDEVSNRRTFAYLIATLNASHPDYDFSHVLRPSDFKRERVLRRVMTHIDSTLRSVRPTSMLLDVAGSPGEGIGHHYGSQEKSSFAFANNSMAPAWGPQMWSMVDKEMTLKDCTIFSYQPADDPFDEEEGAIWALHYFFFNKTLKRVCYLYVRGTPVMSSHSPRIHHSLSKLSKAKRMGVIGGGDDGEIESGATKRARYWLGDRFAEQVTGSDEDMEDDGFIWNRDADGDLNWQYGDEDDSEDLQSPFEDDEDEEEEEEEEEKGETQSGVKADVRGVSEDIASRMEIDV